MTSRLPSALLSGLCVAFLVCGDVTDRFQTPPGCAAFFYKGQPPSGFVANSQSRLCQRLGGKLYFATLYDRAGRLPVYSAFRYKYQAKDVPRGKGVDRSWKYEPQLVNEQADGNMSNLTASALRDPAMRRSQATEVAYPLKLGEVHYVRGQLNPANFQGSRDSRSATFTLTNAITYPRAFHQRSWKPTLNKVAQRLRDECQKSHAYLLAGATRQKRGKEVWAPPRGKGRTAVPQTLWIAFCCANGVSGATVGYPQSTGKLALAGMDLGPYDTRELSVHELEGVLAQTTGRHSIRLFDGGCTQLSGNEN
ncbi:endonuclease domain-containing 1 protein-like [Scyliorhinus torazame]|uniref:endonuclease domain-containing 1 protein-like n=1 Tax=Scyliorhinus torazame TaxID=75743 RepID=UPI003B5A4168